MTTEEPREAGPVHVGHQMWQRLGLDGVLAQAGLSARTRVLTEIMTLNRLVCPPSEHAMPDWVRRTALADLLGETFDTLGDESLYRNLDRLHPQRVAIERALAERERTLFNLDDRLFLYDLTSTYFEGQALQNPQARRGYSRDGRPDCKQVVVGLVLDRDGFPKAHEVFDGNRTRSDHRRGHAGGAGAAGGAHAGARRSWWTGGWPSPTTCSRSRSAAITTSWRAGKGSGHDHLDDFEDGDGVAGDRARARRRRTRGSRRPAWW